MDTNKREYQTGSFEGPLNLSFANTGLAPLPDYSSRPVHLGNNIFIQAPRERIFEIVSDLARWPERLPHYRYVRFLEQEGPYATVAMSARRGLIPVSWVSSFQIHEESMELRFEHLSKLTKGMVVAWKFSGTRDGTRVEIVHDLKFRIPALAWLFEPLVASFVHAIAGKTLATFKELIEAEDPAPAASVA